MNDLIIGGGLLPLPPDERDFKLGALFAKDLELPTKDFEIKTLGVKDQGQTDFCAAFSTVTASECQELKKLSPIWQFAKAKQLSGEYKTWGIDLRTACQSLCKFGSLPEEDASYDINDGDRDFLANWNNWNPLLDNLAKPYSKKSFFAVTGGRDTFDNIRSTLWHFKNENRTVVTGTMWYQEWTDSKGIIPKEYSHSIGGHAFIFTGQKKINGEWHLVAQLSNGTGVGDGGKLYFPREIVNKECTYGAYTFLDLTKEEAEYVLQNNLKIGDNWVVQLYKSFASLLKAVVQYIVSKNGKFTTNR